MKITDEDLKLRDLIPEAKAYYMKEFSRIYGNHRHDRSMKNILIFDKYLMATSGMSVEHAAVAYKQDIFSFNENLRRARAKTLLYKKLKEKGML